MPISLSLTKSSDLLEKPMSECPLRKHNEFEAERRKKSQEEKTQNTKLSRHSDPAVSAGSII